jgi:hypothetical protein
MSVLPGARPSGQRIRVGWHVGALACTAASGYTMTRLHPVADLRAQFALVGALYALALAVALTPRLRPAAIALFVLAAGVLNAGTAMFALSVGAAPRLFGVPAVLPLSAAIGAVAYALLLRSIGFGCLGARESAALALACALATALASRCSPPGGEGLWCLSLAWWLTFSAILCYLDRQARPVPT